MATDDVHALIRQHGKIPIDTLSLAGNLPLPEHFLQLRRRKPMFFVRLLQQDFAQRQDSLLGVLRLCHVRSSVPSFLLVYHSFLHPANLLFDFVPNPLKSRRFSCFLVDFLVYLLK